MLSNVYFQRSALNVAQSAVQQWHIVVSAQISKNLLSDCGKQVGQLMISAKFCEVSRASLYRWDSIFQELGDAERPPSPLRGPARILTRALLTACQDLFAQESDLFLDEVVLWLAVVHGIRISTTSLSRNLWELGLTHKMLHKLAAERDEQRHEEFQQMIHDELLPDGSQIVTVDETSKNELTWARRWGRAMSGERAELTDVFVCGDHYSIVAAITTDGYIAVDAIEGSYDTELLNNFIAEKVLRSLLAMSLPLPWW